MAHFDEPSDPSLWLFPTHPMKSQPVAMEPLDLVADFDQHQAFVSTAAATIKMEIEGATTDDSIELHDEPHSPHTTATDDDHLDTTTTTTDELERRKKLSIERRRKRNREAMQRSRQRDKDYMDGLRNTAASLEKAHNALVAQMNERLSLTAGDSHLAELQTQLEDARRQAHDLMEQNLKFQTEITERIKGEDRMEGLLKELLKEQARNLGALSAILYDHLAPRLTLDRAMEYIMLSRTKRQCIAHKCFQAQEHLYNFFGWEIRHYFMNKYLYMKFCKTFRNRTAEEVAERTWDHVKQQVSYRNVSVPRKIAQDLNEDTFIQAIDMLDPENPYEFLRIFNLRFRVREPDGVIGIGNQTLPQSHLHDSALENVWASDTCIWIILTPVFECDNATGKQLEHCRVEFVGKTRFGADQLAQRNALETVISLARWEETNIGTAHRLLNSEWLSE